jgi:hypothetical protein
MAQASSVAGHVGRGLAGSLAGSGLERTARTGCLLGLLISAPP